MTLTESADAFALEARGWSQPACPAWIWTGPGDPNRHWPGGGAAGASPGRRGGGGGRGRLLELRRQGLAMARKLAVGDGALGFWTALDEIFPGTPISAAGSTRAATSSTRPRFPSSRR